MRREHPSQQGYEPFSFQDTESVSPPTAKSQDVGAYRSYDLHAVRGDEVRHVEVKGSQGYVEKILLTRNEVTHANEYSRTDLVVVAEIPWERLLDGSIVTQDGHMDVHPDWRPSPENLKPLSYEYFLD